MKRLCVLLALSCVAIATATPAFAVKATPQPATAPRPITARAYIAVDLSDNGTVLLGQNIHKRVYPASTTKIITALVARDQYRLDDVVTISPVVNEVSGSEAGLKPGMKFTVLQLLYMLLLPSANDAAMALAAHHPAGYEHFIQLMNEKARALGAYDSEFRTPHGLDTPGHYTSAYDLAIFARALLADPVLATIVNTRHYAMPWPGNKGPLMLENHNHLLLTNKTVFGVKTGFTNLAGDSLVCAAHTSVGDILTVVMYSNYMYADTESLWAHARARILGAESGGGGILGAAVLPLPPKAPVQAMPAVAKATSDPRDDIRWGVLMIALALLTVLTLTRRRRDPLGEAALLLEAHRSR